MSQTGKPNCVSSLERTIAGHLAEWDTPYVELAIYGFADARAIAKEINDFCRREVGAPVADALFYQSSVGAVAGVSLDDGRQVVVKAHQPDWSRARLEGIARLQNHIASRTGLAPMALAGPAPLGKGWGVIESCVDRGVIADAHDPQIRRALATSLYIIVEVLEPFTQASDLLPLMAPPEDALWPTPHS